MAQDSKGNKVASAPVVQMPNHVTVTKVVGLVVKDGALVPDLTNPRLGVMQ